MTNGGDAFSITTPPAILVAADGELAGPTGSSYYANIAATHSASGTMIGDPRNITQSQQKATCLYDFLLITGARDPNTGFEADRFCGNELNPSPGSFFKNPASPAITAFIPGTNLSVKVCSKFDSDL